MVSAHDLDLVARIQGGTATGVLVADDPAEVAAAVTGADGAVRVDVDALACAVAGAKVRLAELVVIRAREAEHAFEIDLHDRARSPQPSAEEGHDGRDADREAVRFALVVLVLALLGGIAVYLADGMVLAPAAPAAALVALAVVVLAHRRPAVGPPEQTPLGEVSEPVEVDDTPVVRAAQAHLRRQQAAWKVAWWEREEAPPEVSTWSAELPASVPVTLVGVDEGGEVRAAALAAMTATAPAAVRVVVLQARG